MASNLCRFTAYLVLLVASGFSCNGQQLYMKHAPPYVVFQSQSPDVTISSSELHNVLAGPLGLNNLQTEFIQSKSVLKRPKANVLFTLVTHKDRNLPVDSMASFRVHWDDQFDAEQLMNTLQKKFLDKVPVMLDVLSSNQFFDVQTSSSLFQSLPSSFDAAHKRYKNSDLSFLNRLATSGDLSLNSSISSDGTLLAELQMVDDVISTLKSKASSLDTKIPDLLSFTLSGLQAVGEVYGVNSKQAKDAEEIITIHLDQIVEDLKSLYKGNVMIEILTVPHFDMSKARKSRSLMAIATDTYIDHSKLNLEIDWYADFPVIFNIVLWLMVILAITVLFVAYGIWNLNPNLESILYRVPQDDLKKLN